MLKNFMVAEIIPFFIAGIEFRASKSSAFVQES